MHLEIAFKKSQEPHVVTIESLLQPDKEYFHREPRVDPSKLCYNFEQYNKYTNMLKRAKVIDDAKSERFYKLVKYVRAKQVSDPEDNIVKDFTQTQGFDADLINIPDEFASLDIADVRPEEYRRKGRSRNPIKRSRTAKNMENYDAWRNHDRTVFTADAKHPAVGYLHVAPRDLVKVFGSPDEA